MSRHLKVETWPAGLQSIENTVLKTKNLELAKALTHTKKLCTNLEKEKLYLQRRIFSIESENLKMKGCLKTIYESSCSSLNKMLSISDDLTSIIQNSNYCVQPNIFGNDSSQYVSTENKTQAVKPMISGLTILRPTINLQRVSDEQLANLMNSSNNTKNSGDDQIDKISPHSHTNTSFRCRSSRLSLTESLTRDTQEDIVNDEAALDELSSSDSSINEELELASNNRLDTVEEDDENVTSVTINNSGLYFTPQTPRNTNVLPDIFKDVKVCISPLKNSCSITLKSRTNKNLSGPLNNSDENKNISSDNSHRLSSNNTQSSLESKKSYLSSTNSTRNGTLTIGESGDVTRESSHTSQESTSYSSKYEQTTVKSFGSSTIIPDDFHLNNLSTIVNSNLDISDYQNNLSVISTDSPELNDRPTAYCDLHPTNISVPITSNKMSEMINNDYDPYPFEGPSTLIDKQVRPTSRRPCEMLKTSTPYNSPLKLKISKRNLDAPSNITERNMERKYSGTNQVHHQSRFQSFELRDRSLSQWTNCTVEISRLPSLQIELNKSQQKNDESLSQSEHTPTTRTKKSISSECSSAKSSEPKQNKSPSSESPLKRGRRNVKCVNLKEPSLRKKMRR